MKTSQSTAKIVPALAALAKALKNPPCSAVNPHFRSRYAPLDESLELLRPAMAEHGLFLMQEPVVVAAGGAGVAVRLWHTSNEWIEFEPLLLPPSKSDPQGIGSAITYARRYSLFCLFALAGDQDDDGNAASATPGPVSRPPRAPATKPTAAAAKPAATPPPAPDGSGLCSNVQCEHLLALAQQIPITPSAVCAVLQKDYDKSTPGELTAAEADSVIVRLQERIAQRNKKETE